MSFLVPLYIAGALAVALPIAFHLIRRTPRGEIPFSSLMFLAPSPPRITRRSRIEHWLLLALRSAALVLLALAFARPFWRQAAQAPDSDVGQRRIAVLIDASASMRRAELWPQAVAAVDQAIAAARPLDEIGVYAFDETLRPVASFDDLAQVPAAQRKAVVAERLAALAPGWAATRLGQALLDAVALVSDGRDASEEAARAARSVILVSDMQSGSRLGVLGDAPWPADVQLELKPVRVDDPTSASLWRLADDVERRRQATADARELRIRVANAADSRADEFHLQWRDAAGRPHGPAVDAYVPAGENRILRVALPTDAGDQPRLVLDGDAHPFDNTLYVVPADQRQLTVAFLGPDAADDPQALRYYLERAVTANPARDVRVEELARLTPDEISADRLPLVVATAAPTSDEATALRRYLAGGGTVLCVLASVDAAPGLAPLLDLGDLVVEEAPVDDYAMLADVDFSHPLFAAMAGPKYNDFTQIRFWRHRRLRLDDAPAGDLRVVARFDDGDPAIVERRLGAGRVLVMTAGWQPADGQLARSWKFLLMLSSLVDNGGADRQFRTEYVVGERVALPPRSELAADAAVTAPNGQRAPLTADADAFTAAAEPGVYELDGAAGPLRFAVNIDPTESDAAPLSAEAFEQLGCRLAGRADAQREAERLQQLRDVELEGRQRIWQWLAAAALAVLIVETWLAGRLSKGVASQFAVG